jgi:prephenate dehydrogenase
MTIPASKAGSSEQAEYRAYVDRIDREVLVLLAQRTQLARRAARMEAREGQASDAARDEALLAERRAWAADLGLEPEEAEDFFRILLRLPRRQ